MASVFLLAVAGCGDDTGDVSSPDPEPSETTSAASGPSCDEVWSADTLPDDYQGCVEDGALVEADRIDCESGQVLVTYGDRYYAVLGGPINDMGSPISESKQYRQAVRSCGG